MSYIPAGSGTQWGGSVTSINIQRYSDAEEVVAEHTDGAIDEGNQPAAPTEKRARSAAGRVGIFVLLLFVASLAWHVASDLFAPSTSSGAVAASTTQIAPRAAGQVAAIYVTDNQEVEQGQPLFALDPAPSNSRSGRPSPHISRRLSGWTPPPSISPHRARRSSRHRPASRAIVPRLNAQGVFTTAVVRPRRSSRRLNCNWHHHNPRSIPPEPALSRRGCRLDKRGSPTRR